MGLREKFVGVLSLLLPKKACPVSTDERRAAVVVGLEVKSAPLIGAVLVREEMLRRQARTAVVRRVASRAVAVCVVRVRDCTVCVVCVRDCTVCVCA